MFSEGPLWFRDGGFCGPAFREALGLMRASHEHGETMMVEDEGEGEIGIRRLKEIEAWINVTFEIPKNRKPM